MKRSTRWPDDQDDLLCAARKRQTRQWRAAIEAQAEVLNARCGAVDAGSAAAIWSLHFFQSPGAAGPLLNKFRTEHRWADIGTAGHAVAGRVSVIVTPMGSSINESSSHARTRRRKCQASR